MHTIDSEWVIYSLMTYLMTDPAKMVVEEHTTLTPVSKATRTFT